MADRQDTIQNDLWTECNQRWPEMYFYKVDGVDYYFRVAKELHVVSKAIYSVCSSAFSTVLQIFVRGAVGKAGKLTTF